jgi:hypothetical protein
MFGMSCVRSHAVQENHARDIYDLFHSIHKTAVRKATFYSWEEMVSIIKNSHSASLRFVEAAPAEDEEDAEGLEATEAAKTRRGRWYAAAGMSGMGSSRAEGRDPKPHSLKLAPSSRGDPPSALQAHARLWDLTPLYRTCGRSVTSGNGSSQGMRNRPRTSVHHAYTRASCAS